MEPVKFWSRVGHWVRHAGRSDGHSAGLGPLGDDALMGDAARSQTPGDRFSRSGLVFSSKKRQREEAIEKLQAGFLQVTSLVESIQTHLQTQDRRSEQIADALTTLADSTTRLSDAAGAQSEQLGAIAGHMEVGNDRARRWEQTLFEIPKLADAQREALTAISQELKTSHEADLRMAEAMQGFHQAVSGWNQASSANAQALNDLKEAAARRDEDLNRLIAVQSKRYTGLFVVTLVMAAAAIAVGLITLLK